MILSNKVEQVQLKTNEREGKEKWENRVVSLMLNWQQMRVKGGHIKWTDRSDKTNRHSLERLPGLTQDGEWNEKELQKLHW